MQCIKHNPTHTIQNTHNTIQSNTIQLCTIQFYTTERITQNNTQYSAIQHITQYSSKTIPKNYIQIKGHYACI